MSIAINYGHIGGLMNNKPMKRLNKKAVYDSSENMAVQNGTIALAGGVVITWKLLVGILAAIGLATIAGTIKKLGCSCSCRCASNWNTMAAAQGYGNNAVTMARR